MSLHGHQALPSCWLAPPLSPTANQTCRLFSIGSWNAACVYNSITGDLLNTNGHGGCADQAVYVSGTAGVSCTAPATRKRTALEDAVRARQYKFKRRAPAGRQ